MLKFRLLQWRKRTTMIEPLDPNDSQDNRNITILNKINEIIEVTNQQEILLDMVFTKDRQNEILTSVGSEDEKTL